MEDAGPMFLRLSTDALSARDRFDAWREEFALRIARVDLQTTDRAGFFADIDVLAATNLTISRTRVAPCSLTRTSSLLRDGDDDLVFILCLEGLAEVRFGQDHVRLGPGAGTLVANNRLGGFFSSAPATTCSIRISREMARSFAPSVDGALLRKTAASDPALAILTTYVSTVMDRAQALSPSTAEMIDRQMRELLADIVNPASDLARSGAHGGIRAARLMAVQRDVAQHILDPDLKAETVGRRLGLSGRYVQQLVESTGLSFSGYVRERRLELARRLLSDPRLAHKRIIDISEMAGFSDLSHFNRAFRARFGQTPKEARRP